MGVAGEQAAAGKVFEAADLLAHGRLPHARTRAAPVKLPHSATVTKASRRSGPIMAQGYRIGAGQVNYRNSE
jgi:hypothetical protein